jgi:hypothetical protein
MVVHRICIPALAISNAPFDVVYSLVSLAFPPRFKYPPLNIVVALEDDPVSFSKIVTLSGDDPVVGLLSTFFTAVARGDWGVARLAKARIEDDGRLRAPCDEDR